MMIEIPATGGAIPGYLVRPPDETPAPGVVVIQEWWGLNAQIKGVAERLADAGFVALAPDLYRGEVATEPDAARKLAMMLKREQALADIQATVDYLLAQPFVAPAQAGVIGFCMGGALAMLMAFHGHNLGAAVVFYGNPNPTDAELQSLQVPLLGLYGAEDGGIPVERVQEWRQKLHDYGKTSELLIYAGAPHAFFNEERPAFRREAADDAWERSIHWFARYLDPHRE